MRPNDISNEYGIRFITFGESPFILYGFEENHQIAGGLNIMQLSQNGLTIDSSYLDMFQHFWSKLYYWEGKLYSPKGSVVDIDPIDEPPTYVDTYFPDIVDVPMLGGDMFVFEDSDLVLVAKHLLSKSCLLYTSPSPRDQRGSRMPSSA